MWTATIKSKEFSSGQFKALVEFSNGTHTIEDKIQLTDSQSLNNSIRSRIKQLTDAETFAASVQTGIFTPTEPAVQQLSAYDAAVKEVIRLKELVTLGAITETNQEYINAVNALKFAYMNK